MGKPGLRKRRKRRRLRVSPLLIIIALAVIVAAVVLIIVLTPGTKYTDLEYYYNLTADPGASRLKASDNELAIVLQQQNPEKLENLVLQNRALKANGHIYVKQKILQNNVDSRLYADNLEKRIVVTTAQDIIEANADANGYTVNGETNPTDYPVAIIKDGEIYLDLDFADKFSSLSYEEFENPARVVISHACGKITTCEVKNDTEIRVKGGIKSNIVGKVKKGEILQVHEDVDGWLAVMSSAGFVGYIKTGAVKNITETQAANDYAEPEYTSLKMDVPVRLGWLGIDEQTGEEDFPRLADNAKIMNVVSPSWYQLGENAGEVHLYTNPDLVAEAHARGIMVWPLFDDVSVECANTLRSTSGRRAVISAVIADMNAYGIDGINLDFEMIGLADNLGNDYIQFVRELSVECRKNGKYLSVDNYAPYEYNACYQIEEQSRLCDYVVVFLYDDYVGSGTPGPNSSLPFIREVLDLCTKKINMSKMIGALPFYSRFWWVAPDGSMEQSGYYMQKAWDMAAEAGVTPVWDEELGNHYTEFEHSGERVLAWIEGPESIRKKMELLNSYGTAGMAGWKLGQEMDGIWEAIAE